MGQNTVPLGSAMKVLEYLLCSMPLRPWRCLEPCGWGAHIGGAPAVAQEPGPALAAPDRHLFYLHPFLGCLSSVRAAPQLPPLGNIMQMGDGDLYMEDYREIRSGRKGGGPSGVQPQSRKPVTTHGCQQRLPGGGTFELRLEEQERGGGWCQGRGSSMCVCAWGV